jgi:hypothetical protein
LPTTALLLQVRGTGRAIMQMSEEQVEFEHWLTTTESRLEWAAQMASLLGNRLTLVAGNWDGRNDGLC